MLHQPLKKAMFFSEASSVDLCANPDSICDKDQMAWLTAIAYWQQNSKPWDEAHTFESSLEVRSPCVCPLSESTCV